MKHKHHIIPKHMGGTDAPSNLIELTPKQHASAHKKLYEKYGKEEDYLAWKGLSGHIGKEEIIKGLLSMNGKRNQKKTQTKEAIQKMAKTKKGSKLTEEHKKNISEGLKGHVVSDKQKKKVSESVSKEYIITNPQGRTFTIKNLLDFARKNNLDQGNLVKVAQHKLKTHKGFKAAYK